MVRELLYLRDEDRLFVHDDIEATDPTYVKKWILHSVHRPEIRDLRVVRGTAEDGILESRARAAKIVNGNASLRVQRVYPRNALVRVVGGPNHQYYVERDGDDSRLDGRNYAKGARHRRWFDVGSWRLELQPDSPRIRDRFLIALTPSVREPRSEPVRELSASGARAGAAMTDRSAVVFVDPSGARTLRLTSERWPATLRIVGIEPGATVRLRQHSALLDRSDASRRGTAVRTFDLARARPGPVDVSW